MTFKPALWQPIAVLLSALNVAGVGVAAAAAEPWHAAAHAVLGLGLGLWAQRLGRARRGDDSQTRLDLLETELLGLRRELTETQERLDFAERVLAQGHDPHRLGVEREEPR